MNIEVSTNFKKRTLKAILSIVLFMFVYIILLVLAVGLTALCAVGGFYVITVHPSFITLMLGVGLASLGFFILAFLFKFLFKKHKIDRSHLTEISEEDEPKLFAFIREIVNEAGTDFPKKIYLSSEVNASVFYDSSFWSLFFPVKKNLQIGLGLVNAISLQELKAILAHEFGHFSQKSMKVGSYVYYVNQVVFNMLYDNDTFDKMIQKWANVSGYFSIFLMISFKIIEGIQWVLKKMYEVININYLALSREMEFHADEVAANIAGISPLQESLLRMDLVDSSYNTVLNFYGEKIAQRIKSKNIYKEQCFVLNFLATDSQLEFKNNLPVVTLLDISKFNKSKLNIENQWASHPSIEDRNAKLQELNIHKEANNNLLANAVFNDIERTEERLTSKLFSNIEEIETFEIQLFDDFKEEYQSKFINNTFNKIYNGYYDNKIPNYFDINNLEEKQPTEHFESLFDKEKIDMVYDFIALENDKLTINSIAEKNIVIKTFDYDGHKFNAKEANELIPKIEKNIENLKENITKNDIKIFLYFKNIAKKQFNDYQLIAKYKAFFTFDKEYDKKIGYYKDLIQESHFMTVVTPIEQIKSKIKKMYPLEIEIKRVITDMLVTEFYQSEITDEIKESFELYLKEDWIYFSNNKYIDEEVKLFYAAINNYIYVLSRGYFVIKKDLLDFQSELLSINETISNVK
jgi:Zn-dependent protease with chaperone function